MVNKDHPYIFIDINRIIDLRSEVKDTLKYADLLKQCDKYVMDYPILGDDPNWYFYTGKVYELRNRIENLCLAYVLSGETKYADEAKRELEFVLENIIGVNCVLKKELDYNTGIIAGVAGLAYDWLYNYLTEGEREKIRKSIILLFLDVYMECAKTGGYSWCDSFTTSSAVINGGIGVAILALYNEWRFAPKAYRTCYGFIKKYFFDNLFMDGGYVQGLNQWRIAMGQALMFLAALESSTGENFFYSSSWFRNAGLFPVYFAPFGELIGFGEMNRKFLPKYNFTNWIFYFFSLKTKNPVFAWYRDKYLEGDFLELLWDYKVDENFIKDFPKYKVYKSIGWGLISTGLYNEGHITVSFKNGWSKGQSLCKDLNSFVLDAFGQRIIYDPGFVRPTSDTSGVSDEHNTLTVNEKDQEECDGEILYLGEENECIRITGDASEAYGNLLTKFIRNIVLVDSSFVLLVDEIEARCESKIQWLFHTLGEATITDYGAELSQKGVKARLYLANRENFTIARIEKSIPPNNDYEYKLRDTKLVIENKEHIRKYTFIAVIYPYVDKNDKSEFRVNKTNNRIIIENEIYKDEAKVYCYELDSRHIERIDQKSK